MKFDKNRNFPLIDFTLNCKDHLDSVLYKYPAQKEFVCNFYSNIVDDSFLKNIGVPCWIVNLTVFEHNYQILETHCLTPDAIDYFNHFGLHIFLSEPLNFLKNNFWENTLLEYFAKFAKNNNLRSIKIFTCEHGSDRLNGFYPELQFFCKDIFLTLVSVDLNKKNIQNIDFKNQQELITKKFWCGNATYGQHRQYITSYLAARLANISWPFDYKLGSTDSPRQGWTKTFDDQIFLNNAQINHKLIYQNLVTGNALIRKKSPWILDGKSNSLLDSAKGYYNECFCAVVTETYFDSDYSNISEKTLCAINYAKPFVLVAPAGSLQYVRSLGFKTFDAFWDESYDQENDSQKRLIKIFNLIDCIDSMSVSDLKLLYNKMIPILEHNADTLKKFSNNLLTFPKTNF
jgi:hypothetical protein